MALIDHILACNNADLSDCIPFVAGGWQCGWIYPNRAAELSARYACFTLSEYFGFTSKHNTPLTRSLALRPVLDDLVKTGDLQALRGEGYRAAADWSGETLFTLDRAAAAYLGLRSYGVHINGFVRKADGLYLWVAERAHDRTFPGMLDNTVAGGQPSHLSLMENVIKECAEEAAIPEVLARQATAIGCITYAYEDAVGIHPDCMYCYDIALPEDFTPVNTDGEVHSFSLWRAEEVLERVRSTFDFKFNCNLALIDFFIRHGTITAESEPDYTALCHGLRQVGPFSKLL